MQQLLSPRSSKANGTQPPSFYFECNCTKFEASFHLKPNKAAFSPELFPQTKPMGFYPEFSSVSPQIPLHFLLTKETLARMFTYCKKVAKAPGNGLVESAVAVKQ